MSDKPSDSKHEKKFEIHLKKTACWLEKQPNIRTLNVYYHETIAEPRKQALTVNDFLGKGLKTEAMMMAVDKMLYRQRSI